jgi:alkylation response protein AidB-like acyl-CoA dehydrogenase
LGNFLNCDGLGLNKNQDRWKQTAEAVGREVLKPNAERIDRQGVYPSENNHALGEAGLLSLLVSKEFGGQGEKIVTAVVVTEAIAKACATTAIVYHMHQSMVPVLCAMANADQVERFIRPIAQDKWVGAFPMSEFGSGNKIWHMDSFALPKGDAFEIDCVKSFCTSAGYADFYLVPVRAHRHASQNDLSMFLIQSSDKNIKFIGEWDGMGLRGNSSRPIQFDHCTVPAVNRFGKGNEGFSYLMAYSLPIYLCGLAAVYIGIAQAAYDAAVEHVKHRIHSDNHRSLAHLEIVQRLVAEMRISIDNVRSTTMRVARQADDAMVLFDEYKNSGRLDQLIRDNSDDLFFVDVASLKPAACEMAICVTNKALQVCGGAGYKRGHIVERCYRDGRAGSVMGPSDDTVKSVMGTQILGLPQPWN